MLSLSSYFSLPFMWKGSLILMSRWDLGRYCAQGGHSSFEFYLLRGRNSPGLIHKKCLFFSTRQWSVSSVFFTSSAGLSLTGWLNWSTSFSYAIFFFSLIGLYVDSFSNQLPVTTILSFYLSYLLSVLVFLLSFFHHSFLFMYFSLWPSLVPLHL